MADAAAAVAASDKPGASTQYNAIASAYSELYPVHGPPTKYPIALVEEHQVKTALTSPDVVDIRGKHVLDLACGTGFYSFRCLEWGAASVTGVDISASMLEIARVAAREKGFPETKARFVQGDATSADLTVRNENDTTAVAATKAKGEMATEEDGLYDIVMSAWLLGYAPDKATLRRMWMFIARHLKPGGMFVTLCTAPVLTALPFEKTLLNSALARDGAWGKYGNAGKVLREAPGGDGYEVRMELGFPDRGDELAVFDCYHLRNDVYEAASRETKCFDYVDWRGFEIPERMKRTTDFGYWNALALRPNSRVCVAKRSS